jgi:hypothetical protein
MLLMSDTCGIRKAKSLCVISALFVGVRMSIKVEIKAIISSLQGHVKAGTLGATVVREATSALARQGYQYDSIQFPELPTNFLWDTSSCNSPQSLAEALLLKMGKWTIYKSFVEHHINPGSVPKNTDVVFFAFAKHLKDRSKPIYDQHALRALWAIDINLSPEQGTLCRGLLAKRDGIWKQTISGSKAPEGYKVYVERIDELCKGGAALGDVDKLLMPLGQAIKDHTANVAEFRLLSGFATQ